MNKFEFCILGTLIDFPESFDNIIGWINSEFLNVSEGDVKKALIKLCKDGVISIGEKALSLEEIKDKVEFNHRQWGYGLTARGLDAWEQNAEKFGKNKIDWSDTYEVVVSYEKNIGYIWDYK